MASDPTRPAPELVTDPAALRHLARRLKRKPRIALDTEAASFHRYVDRVYLVQLSSDEETALVDPLAVTDLSPIGDLLTDPSVETILHDADYDLRILDRDYGFRCRSVWDTRVAAQLAGEPAVGLGALLEKYFDMRLSKKLQRADWSQRPLTDAMIAYAAADTAHLPALRDQLERRLIECGRLAWAQEEFQRLEQVRWTQSEDGTEFLRLKGAKALPGSSRAILKLLWEWRETTAARLDRAPFRVVGNDALVAIAKAVPESGPALRAIGTVPKTVSQRYGGQILDAVKQGAQLPRAEWPKVERAKRPKADPDADARYKALRALRADRAQALELDPGLLCPNGTLQAMARAAPRSAAELDSIPGLRKWQREAMGELKLLSLLKA